MEIIKHNNDYKLWFANLKQTISQAQIKAASRVNYELLDLYWNLGVLIVEKQKTTQWGDKLLETLSDDLTKEFPDIKGFSKINLFYIKKWYLFYNQTDIIIPQLVEQFPEKLKSQKNENTLAFLVKQIPWGHNREIITKCKDLNQAVFYVIKTIQNSWSRAVLLHQIELNLFDRQGKAINNFDISLPKPHSDLAKQMLKDPYCFDFIEQQEPFHERQLQKALTDNLIKLLLELGNGFAFLGKEYHLEIEKNDYYIDLLFYHTQLHCYVVVELKTVKFEPEFAGKLNFYLAAVDTILKTDIDKPSIGLLICKEKNNVLVEFALRNVKAPIGVSEYQLTKIIPDNFKDALPTIEDIEKELNFE